MAAETYCYYFFIEMMRTPEIDKQMSNKRFAVVDALKFHCFNVLVLLDICMLDIFVSRISVIFLLMTLIVCIAFVRRFISTTGCH